MPQPKSTSLKCCLLLLQLVLLYATAAFAVAADDKPHGGQLIQIKELGKEDVNEDGAIAWKSDSIATDAYKNPYKVVFTITGTAKADGEASVRFDPWWIIEKVKPGQETILIHDGAEVTAGNPKTLKQNASAGEPITFVAESTIISFKSAESVLVNAALDNITNFTVAKVEASAWADAPDSGAWWKVLLQAPILLLALVMAGLIWWWKQ